LAGYGKTEYAYGVLPFKTGRCTNQDGHLKFKCAIDYKKAPWAIGKTEIDHIDGNHLNNTLKNCKELCSLCHTFKGMLTGDFKNQNGHYEFNSQGIILRLRSSASDEASSTVKVKVSGVNGFIKEDTSSNDEKYKCEEDRYRDKINYFCSLSQGFNPQKETRFSKHQKTFLNKSYTGSLEIEGLTPFGPVSNTVWTFHRSKGFVLEEVALPNSPSFNELSVRVSLSEAEERYKEYSDLLLDKKLNICPIQESKTLKILNFFQK
jgi:hypothetical protein